MEVLSSLILASIESSSLGSWTWLGGVRCNLFACLFWLIFWILVQRTKIGSGISLVIGCIFDVLFLRLSIGIHLIKWITSRHNSCINWCVHYSKGPFIWMLESDSEVFTSPAHISVPLCWYRAWSIESWYVSLHTRTLNWRMQLYWDSWWRFSILPWTFALVLSPG